MRNRYVLLADVMGVALAAFGAFAMRFDWFFFHGVHKPEFLPFLLIALVAKPSVFYLFGLYGRYWRYTSVNDLLAVIIAVATSSVVVTLGVVAALATGYLGGFSRVVLLMDGLLTLIMACGVRVSIRLLAESRARGRDRDRATVTTMRRVLVAGAGDAGALVVREMQRNPHLGVVPVGFLDDERVKQGKRIYGVQVLAYTRHLAAVVAAKQVDEVVIAMPTAPGTVVRTIVDACRHAGVPSRTMPGVYELIGGAVSVSRLRDVDITDLLRRSQVTMPQTVAAHLTNRVVLVTGAGGSIGLELCRQVAHARPQTLILLGHGENSIFEAHAHLQHAFPGVALVPVIADIRDRARLTRVFTALRPAIVFHAAAHKHVPLMEHNPEEAVSNNVVGTANVVDAAIEADVERLVLISTDKAVSPVSVMGASKRMAEMIVRDAAKRSGRAYVVVRFGNVLGSRGSVVATFRSQLERGGPITITHPDMTRFFMTIPEAVHLVLEAGGLARGGELFVLNMGPPIRIVDLARDLIRLSGFGDDEIPIEFSSMRPGEKLTEQLWEQNALVQPTANPEILNIVEPDVSSTTAPIDEIVNRLGDAAARGDRLEMEGLLAMNIRTFSPLVRDNSNASA